MKEAFFFGYGSLVNRSTHNFAPAAPARVSGWQRLWVQTAFAPQKYLSVVRTQKSDVLWGLVACVREKSDWQGLDAREAGYERVGVDNVEHPFGAKASVVIYSVPHAAHISGAPPKGGILLSYIDTVIQGFFHEFGEEGVEHFFSTTHNWTAIINDRDNPNYPRAQNVRKEERALVDAYISRFSLKVE